jgi:hypothetical protein
VAAKHSPKRAGGPDATVVAKVLQEVSEERRRVHLEGDAAFNDYQVRNAKWQERLKPLQKPLLDADADLKAHERYKGQVPEQQWAATQRDLLKAKQRADTPFQRAMEQARKDLLPLRQRMDKAAQRAQELAKEWEYHSRLGRAAGVDQDQFWTPEKEQGPQPVARTRRKTKATAAPEAAPAPGA